MILQKNAKENKGSYRAWPLKIKMKIKKSDSEGFPTVQKEKRRSVRRKLKFYNMEAIMAICYRINSKKEPFEF